jgi:LPXTG-motif cell wall-anchored protein
VLDEGHDPGSSDLHDPEDTEDTGVLGEVIDRRGDRVLGRLAMTGSDPLVAVAIGLMTVGIGLGLLRRRRA